MSAAPDVRSHDVMALDEIEPGTAHKVSVDGREIALVRIGDDVYAIGDTCSHEEVSLSEGFVDPDDRQIECWRHGAMFDLRSGEPVTLPAVRPVPVYDVAVVDGRVVLTLTGSGDEEAS